MLVPRRWLSELVDLPMATDELAERLSQQGAAVEGVEHVEPDVAGVVVARVTDVADVPGSDKLCAIGVDAGPAGSFQVLAGAKNVSASDVVPLAAPGARVTTLEAPVGVREMMGRRSEGMLCSARELGVSDDHGGILHLDPDAQPGADVVELLGLRDDVIEFEIYPNRPDLMCIHGIAREVAILTGGAIRRPHADVAETGPPIASLTGVEVIDASGCPRYLARVIDDITVGASPAIVQARLTMCGLRPVNNVVDATNHILLLTGQPLHAFDLDALGEQRIVVRRARDGESLELIDGSSQELAAEDLVIADASDAQALAGVMGGAATEVRSATRRVLLESAAFEPIGVSRTARRLHLLSEAAARFERGSDPAAVDWAADLCAAAIARAGGGKVASGVIDVGRVPERRRLELRRTRVTAVLGFQIPDQETERALSGIGCEIDGDDDVVRVTVPTWRPDLEREIDLIEELVRIHGYDAAPEAIPATPRGGLSPVQRRRRELRQVLMGAGLSEVRLESFASDETLEAFAYDGGRVAVTNPMTSDQRWLRPSLVPGLLRAAARNAAQGLGSIAMFEHGSRFQGWGDSDELPDERESLGIVMAGTARDLAWHTPERAVDVYDAKGVVTAVLDAVGIRDVIWAPGGPPAVHPGRAARVTVGDAEVGWVGELRPSVRDAFDIPTAVVAGELWMTPVWAAMPSDVRIAAVNRHPPVLRDIAFAVPTTVEAGRLAALIGEHAGPHLERLDLIDVYEGDQVAGGHRSLAFRMTFRAPDRTLTADEVDAVRQAIVTAAGTELDATPR